MKKATKRKIRASILTLGILLSMMPVLFYMLVYYGSFGKVYSKVELKDIQNYQASEVLSEGGKVLGKFYLENRSNVDFKNVPHFLIDELVATEDARFYEHEGVDFRGLARVFFKTLLMGDKKAGGGSTISQQLSKNLFKRKNYGILSMPVNKTKEAIHAIRIHQVYNQEEILVLYLNTVSMGEDTYGIKNAARRFFNKSMDSLVIEEGAVLIGMLKNPTLYNPRVRPNNALKRRNVVINNLALRGYITKQKAKILKAKPLRLNYKNTGVYGDIAPYFLRHIEVKTLKIINGLKTPDGGKYNFYTDGLKVTTTLNYQMQKHANNAVHRHMKYLQTLFDKECKRSNPWKKNRTFVARIVKKSDRYKALSKAGFAYAEINEIFKKPVKMKLFDWDGGHVVTMSPLDSIFYSMTLLQTGFLAMEPNTGDVKAWVGGNDYSYFQYDHVKSKRQIGSTFKPIVYATAIERGADPCKFYRNEQKVYEEFENWSPKNSGGKKDGKYTMKGALMNSVNVVSVDILLEAGIGNVINKAKKLGITSKIPYLPSIALGVADISLMEMVSAYCAFPNGGRAVNVMSINRIEDRNGKVIWSSGKHKKQRRVFKQKTASYITEMLKGVVNEGTASRLRTRYGLRGAMAGKTGTTQNQADGWFIGYTPGLVAGVWVGAESPKVHFRSAAQGQGAAVALPIWAHFIKGCRADKGLSPYVTGRFVFSKKVPPMPECDNYKEDNAFGKIRRMIVKKPRVKKLKKKNLSPSKEKKESWLKRVFK